MALTEMTTRWVAGFAERLRRNGSAAGAVHSGLPTLSRIAEAQRGLPDDLVESLREPPAADPDTLLSSRGDLVEEFDASAVSWRDGKPSNVALIGPRGSGMSALLVALRERRRRAFAEPGAGQEEIVVSDLLSYRGRLRSESELVSFVAEHLGIELAAPDLEQLVAQIVAGPRRIVFLEDMQDFLLRVVTGIQAMEAFLALASRTSMCVQWVVSCRRQTWRILGHQCAVGRVFPICLSAELPSAEPIAAAVRAWNQALPVPVYYRGETRLSRRTMRPHRQSELELEFLETLWENAGGNPIAARLYWLEALEWDAEESRLTISPLEPPDLGVARTLPREHLYSLLSILQHGGLSPDEHAEIYLTDASTSRRVLEALVQTGLVDPLGDGAAESRYDINPAADARLVSTLENLNLIY